MHNTFRALQYRNYRLFFTGQSVSLIGTWMQQLGMSLLIYNLTKSAVLLGTVNFFSLVPAFFLSPFAGVWLDRWNKRKVIVATQTVSLIQAALLAVLTLTKVIVPWEILALSVVIGLVTAFDTPARQSFMVEIVENRDDLSNAIALNSSQFNLARLIGPPIAAGVIHLVGEGWCFALNAVSYVAVIIALLAMTSTHVPKLGEAGEMMKELRAGASYVWTFVPIRAMLALLAAMSFLGGAYSVLLPVLAIKIYHGKELTLGILFSAVAIGALFSAYTLASRSTVYGLGRLIGISSTVFGVSLIGLGLAPNEWFGVMALVGVGLGSMMNMASTNTLVQTIIEDHMRGRVMAWYTMSFLGTMPIGSLLAGFASDRFGPQATLGVAGAIAIFGSAMFFRLMPMLRDWIHPIYEAKGHVRPAKSPRKITSQKTKK